MKKLISILMFILISSIVTAQVMPSPVVGYLTINGIAPTGYHIEIRNLDFSTADVITSDVLNSLVTERGTFVFDLSYFGFENGLPKYEGASRRYAGDRIEVKVVRDGVGNSFTCSQCIYVFNVPSSFPYTFEMKVVDSTVQIVEKSVIVPVEVVKEVIIEKEIITCSDGTIVTNINECLETESQIKDYLYGGGAVIGAGAIVWLIRHYTKKGKRPRAKKMADTYKRKRNL